MKTKFTNSLFMASALLFSVSVHANITAKGTPELQSNSPQFFSVTLNERNDSDKDDLIIVPFIKGLSTLNTFNYEVMDQIVDLLRRNPSYKIVISGHAYYNEGMSGVCHRLGDERALMVKKYLMSRYVGESRIIEVKSYGDEKPLNKGDNYEEVAKNFRVEVSIIK